MMIFGEPRRLFCDKCTVDAQTCVKDLVSYMLLIQHQLLIFCLFGQGQAF